ncbi:hypothetical protein C8Q74DRAFT_1222450 [Fomes fomentarius]|nr:hypothetical protein C8Q74DRAFT_1222450 [Fomes fomentarius]
MDLFDPVEGRLCSRSVQRTPQTISSKTVKMINTLANNGHSYSETTRESIAYALSLTLVSAGEVEGVKVTTSAHLASTVQELHEDNVSNAWWVKVKKDESESDRTTAESLRVGDNPAAIDKDIHGIWDISAGSRCVGVRRLGRQRLLERWGTRPIIDSPGCAGLS